MGPAGIYDILTVRKQKKQTELPGAEQLLCLGIFLSGPTDDRDRDCRTSFRKHLKSPDLMYNKRYETNNLRL